MLCGLTAWSSLLIRVIKRVKAPSWPTLVAGPSEVPDPSTIAAMEIMPGVVAATPAPSFALARPNRHQGLVSTVKDLYCSVYATTTTKPEINQSDIFMTQRYIWSKIRYNFETYCSSWNFKTRTSQHSFADSVMSSQHIVAPMLIRTIILDPSQAHEFCSISMYSAHSILVQFYSSQ
jgi:hypothetical protein